MGMNNNGILGGYQFDPESFSPQGILGLLAQNGMNLPMTAQPSAGFPAPTDVSAAQRQPGQGVTLPQQDASGLGRDAGPQNPFAALFGGLGDAVGGLFGGGGQQAAPAQPGAPQAPQVASGPGPLDHLTAAWQGLGHGGLTSALGGLITGQRQDPEGLLERALVQRGVSPDMAHAGVKNPQLLPTLLAEQGQGATYQALVEAGLPPGIAHAAALNPEVLKTIAPQLYSKPAFQQIGEDQFGAKQYGFVQPDKMTVTPAGAVEAGNVAGSGTTSFLAPGVKQIDSQRAGDDYLKQFSPEVQAAVRDYIEGRSMPTGNPRKGFTQTIKMIAQKYGNDIGVQADDTAFGERKRLRDQLNSAQIGTIGGQLTAGNTSIGHLADMSDKAIALNNIGAGHFGWVPGSAGVAHYLNDVGNSKADSAPAVNAFNDLRERYVTEITKFYSGSPGAQAEKERAISIFDSAKTPRELAAAIKTEAEAMQYKLKGLDAQVSRLGPEERKKYPVITPTSEGALERIDTNSRRLEGGQGAPQQSQQVQDGATATGPNGHKIMMRGGAWVDAQTGQPIQ